MNNAVDLPDPAVERALFSIVKRERLARDTADWARLEASYWPDSIVRVTWFEGTSEEFVTMSRDRYERTKGGGMHVINPVWSSVDGDRALVESQGQILIRPRLHGTECDVTNWCRFFSRLERRRGEWRMRTFDSIYGKDRIDPVLPDVTVSLDPDVLAASRRSYCHLTYLNLQAGYQVPDDLPGDDRPDLVGAFYRDADDWLHNSA